MHKHIAAAALLATAFAVPAQAQQARYTGLAVMIADQGNAALVEIRAQARADLLAQRPQLPSAAEAEPELADRRPGGGGTSPATTVRASQ